MQIAILGKSDNPKLVEKVLDLVFGLLDETAIKYTVETSGPPTALVTMFRWDLLGTRKVNWCEEDRWVAVQDAQVVITFDDPVYTDDNVKFLHIFSRGSFFSNFTPDVCAKIAHVTGYTWEEITDDLH